jgi:hypothetical protein
LKATLCPRWPFSLLFSAENLVIAELRLLDVNALSPLAALNKLCEFAAAGAG